MRIYGTSSAEIEEPELNISKIDGCQQTVLQIMSDGK